MLDDKKLEQMSDDAMTFSISCQIIAVILPCFKIYDYITFLYFISVIKSVLNRGYGAIKNLDLTEEQIDKFFTDIDVILVNKYKLQLVRDEKNEILILNELN